MNKLEQIIASIKGKHVYIQTHNFPDPDAISSAYGLSVILNSKGIDTTICYKGKIDRNSLIRLVDYLGMELVNMDDLSNMTIKDEIILVDSQKGNSNIVDLIGDEVICIDHHPTFTPVDYRFADIRPQVGACASIIASYYFENHISINEKVATALMYGIKIDTANLTRGVNQLDLDMFYNLYWKSNTNVLRVIERSELQFDDLKAYASAINSIKIYENISIAHTGANCPEQLIASISDFMLALSEIECSIVYSIRNDGIKLSVRSCDPSIDSGALTNKALYGIGSGGGHSAMAGGFVPYPPELENIDLFVSKIEERFLEQAEIIRRSNKQ